MAGRVTRASYSEPYLLFMIDLDAEKIAELTPKVFPHGVPQPRDTRSLYVADADAQIIDAGARLLELMAQPVEAELLAPFVRDQILIRLLRSPMGSRVAQIGQAGSSMQRITNAVSSLRTNFATPHRAGQAAPNDRLATSINRCSRSVHRTSRPVHRSSLPIHRSSRPTHRSSGLTHRSSRPIHRSSRLIHRSSRSIHRSPRPIHRFPRS